MRTFIHTKTVILSLIVSFFNAIIFAQDVTTVEAANADISEHLNLEAVASVFGDAKDLEDFERKLNDPELRISNLDLNNDGYVDYLRVVEYTEKHTHLIAIQAVLGEDIYQDVATIEVEKDNSGKVKVLVVGDVYMYGEDYIIEPVYVHTPVFFVSFWRPYYRPYYSVYYWGYWPHYWHYWHPVHIDVYHHHVYHSCINYHYHYNYVHVPRSHVAVHLHARHRRNDYGRRYPQRSFAARRGVKKMNLEQVRRTSANRRALADNNSQLRRASSNTVRKTDQMQNRKGAAHTKPANIKPVNNQTRKRPAYRTGRKIRSGKPTTKPVYRSGKPAGTVKPTGKPTTKPVYRSGKPSGTVKPSGRPTTKPVYRSGKPAGTVKPSGKPTTKPVYRSGKPSTETHAKRSRSSRSQGKIYSRRSSGTSRSHRSHPEKSAGMSKSKPGKRTRK